MVDMMRVLLVIDDYGEMVYLQILLKKLGFDVDSAQSQRAFTTKQLGFNPQIIIATADGRRVNGIEIAEGLRRRQGFPKVILLLPSGMDRGIDVANLFNVDGTVESPVNVQRLLELISSVAGIESHILMDKYIKMRANLQPDEEGDLALIKGESFSSDKSVVQSRPLQDKDSAPEVKDRPRFAVVGGLSKEPGAPENIDAVLGSPSPINLSLEVREARFKKYLSELPVSKHHGFSRDKVTQASREIRRTENQVSLNELEEERRSFVSFLFSLGKKSK